MPKNIDKNIKYIVGVDEVGRGPIAGPVAVCSLIAPVNFDLRIIKNIKDSKKLSAKKREKIVEEIEKLIKANKEQIKYRISFVDNKAIDKIGISKSLKFAVSESLKGLDAKKNKILLDGGLKAPEEFENQETIIKGDESEVVISLASIIAKVARDKKMCKYAHDYKYNYDRYGFEKHKGYGTKLHYENIKKYGICDLHRKSFLKNVL